MDEIKIEDLQNRAGNMIVGSKQHTLFNPVTANNPPLCNGGQEVPCPCSCDSVDSGGIGPDNKVRDFPEGESVDVVKFGISTKVKPVAEIGMEPQVGMHQSIDSPIGGNDNNSGLNHELHGMLKPCKKQYPWGKGE